MPSIPGIEKVRSQAFLLEETSDRSRLQRVPGPPRLQPVGDSPKSRIGRVAAGVLGALLLWAPPLAAADKVDVVHLKNGDRLTCEIKQLDRSMLTVSTDPMGTVSVHWGEVAGLTSPRNFDVQVASGQHYYGSLLPAPEGLLVLDIGGGATSTLPLAELIRLVPIGSSFWNRIDGNVDAGFSFTQANVETRYTLNGNAQYRSVK